MVTVKKYSENIEKAYNEIFSELDSKFTQKKLELKKAEVDKLKWNIKEAFYKSLNTDVEAHKLEISEIEKNIPILKKDIAILGERINYFNGHIDDIKNSL